MGGRGLGDTGIWWPLRTLPLSQKGNSPSLTKGQEWPRAEEEAAQRAWGRN